MAIDGKLLRGARNALENKRKEQTEQRDRRAYEVYKKSPRIKEIDTSLRATMAELIGIALGGEATAELSDIKARNIRLQNERKSELGKAGFSEDYLDEKFYCNECKDTGYINAKMCRCLSELYKEEQKASLSNLFKLGSETFDSFDLSYYDDTPSFDTGISPRSSMKLVYDTCLEYARKFGSKSMNLFFCGAPGLGKTFLSASIARIVADNGFSVVYDIAGAMFSKFEDAKFSKTDSLEETRDEIKRYLECDLLIIDDLGTEMTTVFTVSVLYDIINTRLVSNKKTIVSSNLTIDELTCRYSQQIMSRLEGEYQVLMFYGDDIRKKRKESLYAD